MKRYLVFYGSVYYPCGGMDDFLSDHDTQEEALKVITDKIDADIDGRDYSWAHIYDTEKRVEVWSK